jgi:hypothetical protein
MFPGGESDLAIAIEFANPISEFLLGWGDPDFEGNVLQAFDAGGQLLEEGAIEIDVWAAFLVEIYRFGGCSGQMITNIIIESFRAERLATRCCAQPDEILAQAL